MGILGAIMVPHPPIIMSEVGKGEERKIQQTINAYRAAAEFVQSLSPETIVISSPHQVLYADYFNIADGEGAKGSMARFGAGDVTFDVKYDRELIHRICRLCDIAGLPAGTAGQRDPSLDHGAMVPLYFLRRVCPDVKIVRIGLSGLPVKKHYALGAFIRQAAEEIDRRVVYIASGDLSHKLKEDGPYGFDSSGPVYDKKIMDVMGRAAFGELFDFSEHLCNKAAECGHRSFVMMAGALSGLAVEPKALSHEDVFGVGYGICTYRVTGTDRSRDFLTYAEAAHSKRMDSLLSGEDIYIRLARKAVNTYVNSRQKLSLDDINDIAPEGLPADMLGKRAGAFVSLHKNGNLRGCIGTICATEDNIALEIITNACSACSADPRFYPVRPDELDELEISVDILGDAETIASASELDVKRYGVIVTKGRRRGLLLPDLDGVDTPAQQIAIAKQKAGIPADDDDIALERFEVIRHKAADADE
ncbi:MAG: AmmeMemoRadiSam system protein A [Oscillospiraceae bacterium]|nr:AmmeMemoRadiSam system protein A [Oscillospiraceae bacterium]MBQ4310773.1 AmmeMemoRadiSam system protein A [Oscillospiraceae bacterium]